MNDFLKPEHEAAMQQNAVKTCVDTSAPDSYRGGGLSGCGAMGNKYRPSLREEQEKSAQYHAEQSLKNQQAAAFFAAHPEFDEFIRLIRSGVIGI